MNIAKFTMKNVKSFGEETTVGLNLGLNIFIGPNAGGKSNLLDIINFSLNYFLMPNWRILETRTPEGLITRRSIEQTSIFENPNIYLDKHDNRKGDSQEIRIRLIINEEDVKNIGVIQRSQDELTLFEKTAFGSSNLQSRFLNVLADYDANNIKNRNVEFVINEGVISTPTFSDSNEAKTYDIFLSYLKNFEFFSLLVQEYNAQVSDDRKILRLYPPLLYFSPYRIPQLQQLITRLAGSDFQGLKATYKKNTSKDISSTFELANHYFARKLRLLNNNYQSFANDEEVKLVNKHITKLGYKGFKFKEIDALNNVYQALIEKKDGEFFEISKASSGEKEIMNMLLGMFAFNVKNGVVIVDEPDLHLHPLWQNVLLELFSELTQERGIQFLLVTHSPAFVTQKSVRSTLRVYAQSGESRVVVPPPLDEGEKDLFQIVNVFNSAKIFFADKVILVEGPVDNLIYHSILKRLQSQLNNAEVVEILDVHGMGNLDKFVRFLRKWQIRCYRIADRGYASADEGDLFVLPAGRIEDYFPSYLHLNKQHFDIDDAIRIEKDIEAEQVEIPQDLQRIFKEILISKL